MSTDLFQALTLGLLVIVILALLVAVSMLGKVRAALEGRARAASPQASGSGDVDEAATVDDVVADVAGADPQAEASPEEASHEPAAVVASGDDEDSDRPFERGGRWYFRRAGELLVYEEGTGEWVPSGDGEEAAVRPAVQQADAVEASTETAMVEPVGASTDTAMVEPVEASTETGAAEPAVEPVEELSEAAISGEPRTSFAGQPLATAEEQVATLGGATVEDTGGAVAVGFEEPGGGGVDLDEAAAAAEEPTTRSAESFWKCESCGAINGSTATSCRMCFAARP